MIMHKKKVLSHRGITLIEAIVAISVLVFAIAGPLTLASSSLRASREARTELVATHLAEEALEVVHNIRSNNSADDSTVNRTQWMQQIFNRCSAGCVVDVTDHVGTGVWGPNALIQCPSGHCAAIAPLYFNGQTSLYRQSGTALGDPWRPSQFSREVLVQGIDDVSNPGRQVRVTATVTYSSYTGLRTVRISEDLYNWFPQLQ